MSRVGFFFGCKLIKRLNGDCKRTLNLMTNLMCVQTNFSVQHECIPQAILSMDVLCQAKSGMGKTAVFVLATLQQIEPQDGQVRFVITTISPSYVSNGELKFSLNINCICIYGSWIVRGFIFLFRFLF